VADAGPPTEAMPAADLPDAGPPTEAMPAADLPEPVDPEATQVRPLPPIDDDALPPAPALPPEREPEPEPPPPEPPPRGPDEPSDEDVLEETPDFLQDTPEHDRLWFEQRPPRDFDFDE
jgi:hypothetical protein